MKFKELELENFGPVERGTIQRRKVSVFFGPNNSGKSMVSKLIYGIDNTDTEVGRVLDTLVKRKVKKTAPRILPEINARRIMGIAGIRYDDVITHKKISSCISIRSTKPVKLKFNGKSNKKLGDYESIFKLYESMESESRISGPCTYVPAGRTGMMQFFVSFVQMKTRFLSNILNVFAPRESAGNGKISNKEMKKLTRGMDRYPLEVEQFFDLILDIQRGGLNADVKRLFSQLFGGHIRMESGYGLPTITYEDPTGFVTDIGSAGSGIIASFPIIVGIYYAKPGGTLIIEEPEAHLEPSKQVEMIDALYTIAQQRNVELIFTTHSDYIVRQLLAMVSSKKIKHSDLGMYYFNRKKRGLTTIEMIDVDKDGDAEQPVFQKALDMLIKNFS